MLQRRLVSALVLVSIAIASIGLDLYWPIGENSGAWMVPLFLFVTLGTVWEMSELLKRHSQLSSRRVLVYAAVSVGISLIPVWYSIVQGISYPQNAPIDRSIWILLGIMVPVGISGIDAMRHFAWIAATEAKTDSKNALQESESLDDRRWQIVVDWALTIAILAYVVGAMSVWFLVRASGDCVTGMARLIAILAVIKFSDAGAYFAGKLIGKTKLVPAISPGKTVEGLLGGMVAGVAVSYFAFRWIFPWLGVAAGPYVWGPAVLGILLTITGLVGDLLESMIKRTVGAKDSGNMLPGLGGIWDVTDSLLPTSVVGYLGVMAQWT